MHMLRETCAGQREGQYVQRSWGRNRDGEHSSSWYVGQRSLIQSSRSESPTATAEFVRFGGQ